MRKLAMFHTRLPLGILAVCVGACVLPAAGVAGPQTRPPTLDGERLTDPSYTITANCNPTGNSTISYHATGTAANLGSGTPPYSGTFTEDGTFTLGPQNGPTNSDGVATGAVLSFSATFTINSGQDQITGTKSFTPTRKSMASGVCNDNVTLTNVLGVGITATGRDREILLDTQQAPASYTATIQDPAGSFTDIGTAYVHVEDVFVTESTGGSYARYAFDEGFASSLKQVRNH